MSRSHRDKEAVKQWHGKAKVSESIVHLVNQRSSMQGDSCPGLWRQLSSDSQVSASFGNTRCLYRSPDKYVLIQPKHQYSCIEKMEAYMAHAYPGIGIKIFKLSCLKCFFRGITTLIYSLSFPPKLFTSIGSYHKALKSGRDFKGSLFQSVAKRAWWGWGKGSSQPPGAGNPRVIICRELQNS